MASLMFATVRPTIKSKPIRTIRRALCQRDMTNEHAPRLPGASRISNDFAEKFATCQTIDGRRSLGHRKIIGTLVVPVGLLDDLHQHVVNEGARAKPEKVWGEPVVAQCLFHHHEVGE